MNNKSLRIAIVAPPFGQIGGPEVATQNLVEGLLHLQQDVTLFAPGDWNINTKHIYTLPQSLWNMDDFAQQNKYVRRNYIIASQMKPLSYDKQFDIFHFNFQQYAYAAGIHMKTPHILTIHNRINVPEQLYQINTANFYTVAVTKSQKGIFPITQIISHGISTKNIIPSYDNKNSYLITIGRITDQKGIHKSIHIAKKANKKLIIIGRIGNNVERQKYYKEKILPHIDNDQIIHIISASQKEIYSFLQNAEALLFPIIRPEVFGLVVAESLACGTPIIASSIDPMPEILPNDREIACISNNIQDLICCAKNTHIFNRKKCRLFAQEHFDNIVMAKKYLQFYHKIVH